MIKTGLKIIVLFLAILAALGYVYSIKTKNDNLPEKYNRLSVSVAGRELMADVADTPEKKALGLSGREKLEKNEGMIFIFSESASRQFWMKDMRFALDIIWLDENKKIVDITKNALPESYLSRAESRGPEKFSSKAPAKYVLEVNAGFADENKIKIGDEVLF